MSGDGRLSAKAVPLSLLLFLGGCSSGADREESAVTEENPEISRIRTLGYVSWSEVPEENLGKSGVTRYDEKKSQTGLNLWNSLPRQEAVLMDARGRVLHSWKRETGGEWGHIELLENGDLLVFHQGPDRLIRLDWESEVVWERPMLVHHDGDATESGDLLVLDERRKFERAGGERVLVAKHYIVTLNPDGALVHEMSLFDVLRDRIDLKTAPPYDEGGGRVKLLDPLHVNTLSVIREGRGGVFRKGRALIASRSLNLIGVVDLETERLVWSLTDGLDRPHQPVLSASGTVFVFDNGMERGYSRIVEFDPSSGEVVSEYLGEPPESFFSRTMGGIQLLSNGNLLVSESERGRAFEITGAGEIVWEFFNPDVEKDRQRRATFYRMTRIEDGMLAADRWESLGDLLPE